MCTVSWLRRTDGYLLFCNRDERRTRKPALGPRRKTLNGVSYVAPVDQDQGGSWIGVNEFGVTLCLLNRYWDSSGASNNYTSRGWLVRILLDSRESKEVHERIKEMNLERFQPFTLAILTTSEAAVRIDWTGHVCLVEADAESQLPLSSSSIDNSRVNKLRSEQFERMVSEAGPLDGELLKQFHCSHIPERGPVSVCMHRDDASTVSLSMVTVEPETIEFAYWPGSPCVSTATESLTLARRLCNP